MRKPPPRIPGWLIRVSAWYEDGYAVYGDACEEYYELAETLGDRPARRWFWRQGLRAFPAFVIDYAVWRTIMLRNYLKVAFRNIRKQKGYAFINISGLAIGMAACILILLWVYDEMSFDAYHENADRIFRLTIDANLGTAMSAPLAPTPAGPAMVRDYPEVVQAVRLTRPNRSPVTVGDREFFEENVAYADNSIFEVFTFPLVEGDPRTALQTAYAAVLTEDIARKYFGREPALGKTLKLGGGREYTVTGVAKTIPGNSHFRFNILLSMETRYAESRPIMENWLAISNYGYVLLAENADPAALEAKLPAMVEKNLGAVLKSLGGSVTLRLQPLKRIHLHSDFRGDIAPQGNILYVYLFSAIALFILVIAGINFVNLSTARSTARAKEVGMRKTLGALRQRLVGQFLGESVVYSLLALVIAVGLILLAKPWLSSLAGRDLGLDVLRIPWLIPGFLALALLVGIAAGGYPAFYLSSFHPVRVLRGGARIGAKNVLFRRILVVTQFVISVVLIIGTMVVYKQLAYMKSKNLGFEKERVVVLPGLGDVMPGSYETLRNEFRNIPGVLSVGATSLVPGRGLMKSVFQPEGYARDQSQPMDYCNIDPGYLPTLGIVIAKGRNFSEELAMDRTQSVLINRTAAEKYGWKDPLGKQFIIPPDPNTQEEEQRLNVIGVVEDFHITSLKEKIEPMILLYDPKQCRDLVVRIAPADVQKMLGLLRAKWKELLPRKPFDSYFLDEAFDSQYRAEERIGKLAMRFSLLAIFVSCLGLFGIASYTTEQRTKEIGVRKVLGASAGVIVRMLSREYLLLVAIGNLIAWPAAFVMMRTWLDNFAYRTSIALWVFLAAGILSIAVSMLTVSTQSVRAARTDPIRSIRYE
jgi:putative ABC transport system permease protein